MLKKWFSLFTKEDGAAVIFGLLFSLVGFGLAYIMMLSAIQSINTANVSVITNRLQNAAETGINDAMSLINSGYDFTGNTIDEPFRGKDRVLQADNQVTDNIRWEWWVEPIDLTNRDECKRTGQSNVYACGYYIYSKASMPVLDENAEVITRGILIPTPVNTAEQTENGDITYSSKGASNFRHGIYGLELLNTGSNVAFYSFHSADDSTNRKPDLIENEMGLLQPGRDNLPVSINQSTKSASVASNQSVTLNNITNSNQQISAYNLYRSGTTLNNLTPHASCIVGSAPCDEIKSNEQDYNYDLTAHEAWIDTICPSYSPAASFTQNSQIAMGVTCLEGDVTLYKNYIVGTSQVPSIFVVKGNVTLAAGADINPYAMPQAFQLYVKDGNITNIPAENEKVKFVGTMLASSTQPDKGEINLAANADGNSMSLYGAMVANKINLAGDITFWHDVNTKYLKNNEKSYYQLFSLKVVSSTRSAVDGELTGTELKPPVNLTATAGPDGTTLRLAWGNPAGNKGIPLSDYTVEISGTDNQWTSVANTPATTYIVTGLEKYSVYNIRVKANNIYGSSAWTVIPALTQGTAPSEPQGLVVTSITNNNAILNWEAPVDDGGKPITGYTVQYSTRSDFLDAVEANLGNVTSFNIENITRSTLYYFRVFAKNEQGTSQASNTVEAETLKTVPSSPVITSIGKTNTTISITWNESTDNGGSPILGYNIYRGNVQANTELISPATFFYRLTGLTQSTSYDVYVTAVNALGESPKQDPATVQTIQTNPDTPNPPTNLTLSEPSTTSVKLQWEAPGSGGAPSQYIITKNGAIVDTVDGLSYTFNDLTPGTYYTFGVSSKNITGTSLTQALTNFVSNPLPPTVSPTLDKLAYLVNSSMNVTVANNTCQGLSTPTYKIYRNNTLVGNGNTGIINITTSNIAETSYITNTISCSFNGITSAESEKSPAVTAVIKTAPTTPSNVRVTEIYGLNISLSWDAVADASSYEITLSTGQKVTSITNTAQITGTARNIPYNNSTTQPATEAYPTVSVIAEDEYGFKSLPGSVLAPISRMRVFPANDYTATINSQFTHSDYNSLVSGNGDRAFLMQGDRNIVTYNLTNNQAIWAASNVVNAFPIDRWNLGTDKNFKGYRNGADGTAFQGNDVQVLVVAGGGGGGGRHGGGGGGGGVIERTVKNITAGSYAVTVGAGGSAVVNADAAGGNGGNSSVFGITAIGGGGGGSWDVTRNGTAGGSGGGASWYNSTQGSAGTVGQGNSGGIGNTAACGCGQSGGGGGAGGPGLNAIDIVNNAGGSGAGGPGKASDILGSTYYFGGGGGGGTWGNNGGSWNNIRGGNGGIGGGGGGGVAIAANLGTPGSGGGSALNAGGNGLISYNNPNGGDGGANTGGGGGGAGANPPNTNPSGASYAARSGAGGSGIVVIKYAGSPKATGGTITQVNGFTIHAFYSSGTFTLNDGPTQVYCPGGCNGDVDMMVMENGGYATNYQWMGTYWRTDYVFQ